MPDVFTRAKRSEVMSRIRSRGNRDTELALAKLFRQHRITGWRRQRVIASRSSRRKKTQAPNRQSKIGNRKSVRPYSRLGNRTGGMEGGAQRLGPRRSALRVFAVRPDFIFPTRRVAVFVDGCFWHGCPKHGTKPRNNAAFWSKKLAANKARDRLVTRTLRRAGWRVLRIWEHELTRRNAVRLAARLRRFLPPASPHAVRGTAI